MKNIFQETREGIGPATYHGRASQTGAEVMVSSPSRSLRFGISPLYTRLVHFHPRRKSKWTARSWR
jgi:hypothetical protein